MGCILVRGHPCPLGRRISIQPSTQGTPTGDPASPPTPLPTREGGAGFRATGIPPELIASWSAGILAGRRMRGGGVVTCLETCLIPGAGRPPPPPPPPHRRERGAGGRTAAVLREWVPPWFRGHPCPHFPCRSDGSPTLWLLSFGWVGFGEGLSTVPACWGDLPDRWCGKAPPPTRGSGCDGRGGVKAPTPTPSPAPAGAGSRCSCFPGSAGVSYAVRGRRQRIGRQWVGEGERGAA